MFERNPNKVAVETEIRVMWPSGPSRRFSQVSNSQAKTPLETGGYAGSYVCQECGDNCVGVYETPFGWVCGGCKDARRVKSTRKVANRGGLHG